MLPRMLDEKLSSQPPTHMHVPLLARHPFNDEKRPSRCVVEDYTREAAVLGAKAGGAGVVTMVSVRDADKLK